MTCCPSTVSLRHVLDSCHDSQHGQLLCVVALTHLCHVQVRTQPPVLVSWRHLLACLLEWIYLFKRIIWWCSCYPNYALKGAIKGIYIIDRNDIKRAVARTCVSLLGSRGTWAHGCTWHFWFLSCSLHVCSMNSCIDLCTSVYISIS